MCSICSTFNPTLLSCAYDGLPDAATAPRAPLGQSGAVIEEDGDAGTTSATAGTIGEGEFFAGSLASNTDVDWIEIDVVAGQAYRISAVGIGALAAQANDLDLVLRDESGTQIAYDDNSGTFFQPTLGFTADATGTYTIEVRSFSYPASTPVHGDYMVSFNEGDKSVYSEEMILGALLSPDQAWTTTAGTGGAEGDMGREGKWHGSVQFHRSCAVECEPDGGGGGRAGVSGHALWPDPDAGVPAGGLQRGGVAVRGL